MKVSGNTILITGGATGIGFALAEQFMNGGNEVIICGRRAHKLEEAKRKLPKLHTRVADISGDTDRKELIAWVIQNFPSFNVLVNNAGWDKVEPFLVSQPETWDKVIAINLRGPINCFSAVLPVMVEQGGGRIVSIASDAGRVGSTGEAVYAGCKSGIVGFSKTIAREMARHKVNVNVVCPGPTRTPLLDQITGGGQGERIIEAMLKAVPWRRLGEPEEIAGAVAFFASDDAGFCTGQVLSVSGGLTMVG